MSPLLPWKAKPRSWVVTHKPLTCLVSPVSGSTPGIFIRTPPGQSLGRSASALSPSCMSVTSLYSAAALSYGTWIWPSFALLRIVIGLASCRGWKEMSSSTSPDVLSVCQHIRHTPPPRIFCSTAEPEPHLAAWAAAAGAVRARSGAVCAACAAGASAGTAGRTSRTEAASTGRRSLFPLCIKVVLPFAWPVTGRSAGGRSGR